MNVEIIALPYSDFVARGIYQNLLRVALNDSILSEKSIGDKVTVIIGCIKDPNAILHLNILSLKCISITMKLRHSSAGRAAVFDAVHVGIDSRLGCTIPIPWGARFSRCAITATV